MSIEDAASRTLLMVALILALALSATSALAQEETKTGADPTDFITRYEPSYEHKELDNGSELELFVLRGDLALRRDISLRVDLPVINFDPDSDLDRIGFDDETGFGDMITQIIYKPYSGDQMAAIVGLRVDWDWFRQELASREYPQLSHEGYMELQRALPGCDIGYNSEWERPNKCKWRSASGECIKPRKKTER